MEPVIENIRKYIRLAEPLVHSQEMSAPGKKTRTLQEIKQRFEKAEKELNEIPFPPEVIKELISLEREAKELAGEK
jgi:hypothetical protein